MKKTLLLLSCISLSLVATAQYPIWDGDAQDSTIFTFDATDSLHHVFGSGISYHANIDTSNTHLWRIGKTHKLFFAIGGDTTSAIMTDTSNAYAPSSNDWFVLKMMNPPMNVIVDFYHKYQTLPQHAGGTVEFSVDSGNTWQNVMGDCHIDSASPAAPGIYTENFYIKRDTLLTGQPVFMGIMPAWKYSRVQFFRGLPIRRTGGGAGCTWHTPIYLRFRFLSDTTGFPPNDGWIIDSIKIEADHYSGDVSKIGGYQTLSVAPNPSTNGFFTFPALNDEKHTTIEITNALGQNLFTVPYTHRVDLSHYPKGLYLYKVINSMEYYSGRLVVQ